MSIIPLILSGGSGTRLWPLSRETRPKQFLSFFSERSLFQETALRCSGTMFDARPIVVGANGHRFLLAEDLVEIGVSADILLEPVARNSCAAIAVGCFHAQARTQDAVVLVLAADHHIPDVQAFCTAVGDGLEDALAGQLVSFGITPSRPATSYGYILPAERRIQAYSVARFVEKPTTEQATQFLDEGYLWNSGNLLLSAAAFLSELRRLAPAIFSAAAQAYAKAHSDLDFLRLDEGSFACMPSVAVDYAIMEKTDRAAVLPVAYHWSDIGSWDSVASILPVDEVANAIVGTAKIVDGTGNLVHSTDRLTTLIGISDMVVVSTRDSLLVMPKTRAGEVRGLVARLQEEGRSEAREALHIFRPWGNYERLDFADGYQVKRIVVTQGGILSLQMHKHRAEHWIIVKGEAEVTIDGVITTLIAGQSVHVPRGAVHRLANHGKEPLVLIEVQTGDYLSEDDIVRLDDVYNRRSEPTGKTTSSAEDIVV